MIIGSSICTYSVSTWTSQDATHPWTNVADLNHLRREGRSGTSWVGTVNIDIGSANIKALLLDDINFNDGYVKVSNDPAFSTYQFYTTISADVEPDTNRRKIIVPIATSQRYIQVYFAGTVESATYYRIGRIVPICSTVTLFPTDNSYTHGASYPQPTINTFKSGGDEIISNGSYKRFQCSFNHIVSTSTALSVVDNIPPDQPMVMWETTQDDSKAWLVQKRVAMSKIRILSNTSGTPHEQVDNIVLTEVI